MNIDCQHFTRSCDLQAPCCKIFYPCQLCHDEQFRGTKADGCQVEFMLPNISTIRCRKCQTKQSPSNQCTNCGIQFGFYYCSICYDWEDDQTQQLYHCKLCNKCRPGPIYTQFHCVICNMCMPLALQNQHKCHRNAFDQKCSICLWHLQIPNDLIMLLDLCGHHMHKRCSESLLKYSDRCPVCDTALFKMSQQDIKRLDKEVQYMRQFFPYELQDEKVDIQCMECRQKSIKVSLDVFMKCQHCGTYNTQKC